MLSRFNRLLIILLLIGAALYIVILNRENVTVRFTPDSFMTLNTGVLLIGVFCAGILATSVVALYFGFKAQLRERRLMQQDRQRRRFLDDMIEARGYSASGESGRARELWEQLIKRDPTNLIASIELSRALEAQGETLEALHVLDTLRAAKPNNIEVLFRAAELNVALHNKTVALDNVALVLTQRQNLRAAQLSRDLAESLGRLEDAGRFHHMCEALGESGEASNTRAGIIRFKQAEREYASNPERWNDELRSLLKQYPTLVPALEALARLEEHSGRLGEAAQTLVRAAKASGQSSYWRHAARLWLQDGKPDRAAAAARSAIHATSGTTRVEGELFLIQLYLGLNQNDEAWKLLNAFPALAEREQITLSEEILRTFLSLKALCLHRLGKQAELVDTLQHLSDFDLPIPEFSERKLRMVNGSDAPSPTLSTP